MLLETNRCLLKDVPCSYECATLERKELVDLIRVPLKKYHNDKELCFDPMTIPTCSNDVPGACDHIENCTSPPPSNPPSPSPKFTNELTERKLSLSRILKFDDINSLLGCATIDVATAMSAEGGYVVDYTAESCTGETCAPSWLGGGCSNYYSGLCIQCEDCHRHLSP